MTASTFVLLLLFSLQVQVPPYHVEAFTIQSPQQLLPFRQAPLRRTSTAGAAGASSENRLRPLQMSSANPPPSFPPRRTIQPPAPPLAGDVNVVDTVAEGAATQPPTLQTNTYLRRGMAGKKGARRVTLRRYLNGLVKTHSEVSSSIKKTMKLILFY